MICIVLERFKNAVPERISTYLNEQQVKTMSEAASLADQYVLSHCCDWRDTHSCGGYASGRGFWAAGSFKPGVEDKVTRLGESERVCHFCQKRGHIKADC